MKNESLEFFANGKDVREQIYEIEKILADFFGEAQVRRVNRVILTNKEGFDDSGTSGKKSSEYELKELKAALIQPEKERLFSHEYWMSEMKADLMQPENERIFSQTLTCEELCRFLISACAQIQSDPIYWSQKEDARSTQVRDILRSQGVFVLDQTLHGHAKYSINPGEVDLMVMKNAKDPLTIIEAMNISTVNTGHIQEHLNKLIDDYNPNGLQELFLVGYVQIAKEHFRTFWVRYIDFITGTNAGPFLFKSIEECETNMFFIKHAVVEYSCDGAVIKVHHICMRAGV